jgi:hypothetical protein
VSIIDRHAGHAGGRPKQKAKLPNEPNLKMPFSFKTLAISHFHPFSKQVKNGKKASISCYFQAVYGSFIGQKLLFNA